MILFQDLEWMTRDRPGLDPSWLSEEFLDRFLEVTEIIPWHVLIKLLVSYLGT